MQQFGVYKVAEIRQKQDTSRSFLLLTYKLYHKLDTLSGTNKAYCLSVLLSLLKYAWKSSNYKCAVRYTTLIADTKLSKMSVRRSCTLLAELGIITIKRLSSANLYSINTNYLKAEKSTTEHSKVYNRTLKGLPQNSINKSINTLDTLSKIDKIISENRSSKDTIVMELIKSCTLDELKEDKRNVYYCGLAIADYDNKRDQEFVPPEKIINALKNVGGKKSNAFYRAKVAHNKKFNLDWKGNPKK
jgi:hypothetical protein